MQEVIRASVTHDKNQTEHKVPVLDIKMPKPSGGNEEKHPAPSAVMQTDENDKEEDEFSEDDWDAFQSFPISKNGDGDESKTEYAAEDKDPSLVENSSDMEGSIGGVEFQACSTSKSINKEKELTNDECLEALKEKHDQINPGANEQCDNDKDASLVENLSDMEGSMGDDVEFQACSISKSIDNEKEVKNNECLEALEEKHDQINPGANEQCDNEHQEMVEELQSSGFQEEATSIPGSESVSFDRKPEVEAEGSTKEDLVANYIQIKDMPEQEVSDSLALEQGNFESDNNEQSNRCDEDAKKDSVDENESHDSQQGMSEESSRK